MNNRLSANLAAFHLTKSNVATTDPNNVNFSIAVGEQTSQGIELDVVGEILTGWNIVANYAYTNAKVTKDNTPIQGNRLYDVPYNSASLWTTYQIQQNDLQGLGFGLGLFYVGEREATWITLLKQAATCVPMPAFFTRETTGGRELISKIFPMCAISSLLLTESSLVFLLLFWGHFQLNFDFL